MTEQELIKEVEILYTFQKSSSDPLIEASVYISRKAYIRAAMKYGNIEKEVIKEKISHDKGISFKDSLKDWEIAKEIFGKNTKDEIKLVKDFRKNGILEIIDEISSIIKLPNDDCGYVIMNNVLNK